MRDESNGLSMRLTVKNPQNEQNSIRDSRSLPATDLANIAMVYRTNSQNPSCPDKTPKRLKNLFRRFGVDKIPSHGVYQYS